MKKISLIILTLFLAIAINAQTADTKEQTNALTEIAKLNGQVVSFYKQKNYDEALKIALQMQQLIDKNGLSKDLRATSAMSNLAEVYLAKGKESEAVTAFQKVLEAYNSNSADTKLPSVKIIERIALAYFYKKDYDKAEEYFLKALPLREKLNGAESRETAIINNALGDIYRKKNQFVKAQKNYLKAIEINDKVLTKTEKENRTDLENYSCFLYHKALQENKIPGVSKELQDFNNARNPAKPDDNTIDSGVINGKAINLVKPQYPQNMRGVSGFALVQVTIDEQGNVISAKATCGIIGFVESVEEAARKSKFSPTSLKGQPVKVTGIIVYNFVR